MRNFKNDEINNIRNGVNIIDVVSSYIPLIKRGKNYFGVCPFHNDTNPSLSVSEEKQIYTCFSCGATGNVFTFIMDYENISFYEALQKVALMVGVNLSYKKTNNTYAKNKELYEIYKIAQMFYFNNINTQDGFQAKQYLNDRGFNDEIIKEFGIGLSLKNNEILTNLLLKKGFVIEDLIKSGLINDTNYEYKDIFYNRIMFPLTNVKGEIVGYSGRIYNNENIAKYINTKETLIFKKGELLYNYYRAKEEIRNKKELILVEGFMDVIRCHSVGIKNVIAVMGTAFTKQQAMLIKKLSSNVIICFDGDEAGQLATLACSTELRKVDINPKVVVLNNNCDPDDYIKINGQEAFLKEIEKAMNIMDFKLISLKKKRDLKNNQDIANYLNDVLDELVNIKDKLLKELTLKKISDEVGIDLNVLKEQLIKKEKNKQNIYIAKKEVIFKKERINKYIMAQQNLLFYMLKDQKVISIYNKRVGFMPTEKYRFLGQEINYFYKEYGNFNLADFFSYLKDNEQLIKTIGEIQSLNLKNEYTLEEIDEYIFVIKEYHINEECNRLLEKMKQETSSVEKAKIANKIKELKVGIKYD